MPPIPQQVGMTPEQIAAYQVDPNQWLRSVLEGQYLGANPYLNQLISQIESDAQRQFQESILPTTRSELNLSGAYGTALGQQAQAKSAEDFARGLMGQTAGIRYQDYGSERDRMQQALQLLSGETVASRQGLFGARAADVQSATGIRQSEIAAAAQRAAANAAASASRYGADRSYAAARLAQQSNYWNNLFNRSQQMRGFFGGPEQSMGQRAAAGTQSPSFSIPKFDFMQGPNVIGGVGGQGAWGGPADGALRYAGSTGDPWNTGGF